MKYRLSIIVLISVLSLKCSDSDTKNHLPNIIVILADDMGYGDLSCYNPESRISTANITTKKGDKKGWYEWAQTLPLMHAGQSPEDIYDWDKIMSVANLKGEDQVVSGPDRKIEMVENACIQVNCMKSEHNPFLILWPKRAKITQYFQEQSGYSRYPWWNLWPVAQIPSGGRYATAPDRPSHSCTSTQDCDEYASTENSVTKVMLCGFTDQDAGTLIPLAKSWGYAPELTIEGTAFTTSGYDASERCYLLTFKETEKREIQESFWSPYWQIYLLLGECPTVPMNTNQDSGHRFWVASKSKKSERIHILYIVYCGSVFS